MSRWEHGTDMGGRSFSNGETVDSIETEKSRIVLHELEKGWWILAVRRPRRTSVLDHANTRSPSTSPSSPPQPPKTPARPSPPSNTRRARSARPPC